MAFGGMMGLSLDDLYKQQAEAAKEKEQAVQPQKGGSGGGSGNGSGNNAGNGAGSSAAPMSRAEEIVDNSAGDAGREKLLRDAALAPVRDAEKKAEEKALAKEEDEDAERERLTQAMAGKSKKEKKEKEIDREVMKYQSMVAATVRASLSLNNVQKLVAVRNQAGINQNLAKAKSVAQKPVGRGQLSTVQIPAALMRHVLQEVGALDTKMSQNDIMTGFLYWYFGKPDGVAFLSDDMEAHVQEVVENLDVNASPAKVSRMNFNMSGSLLERMDTLSDRMDSMAGLMQILSRDSIGLKARSDKIYIALCYELLDRLAFLPPRGAGQHADSIDMMGGGLVWSLMQSVDEGYEYFKDTNGRDIYKAKHGIKAAAYKPPEPVQEQARYETPAYFEDTSGGSDDDDYDDLDYDDMPYVDPSEFEDFYADDEVNSGYIPGMDDPDYDDGSSSDPMAALKARRAEAALYKRIADIVPDEIEGEEGSDESS